jgi:hypothetical protein
MGAGGRGCRSGRRSGATDFTELRGRPAARSLYRAIAEMAGLHPTRAWGEVLKVMSKKATARKAAQKTKQAEGRVKPTKKKTKKAAWSDEP